MKNGFTFIEFMIVVAIVAILAVTGFRCYNGHCRGYYSESCR